MRFLDQTAIYYASYIFICMACLIFGLFGQLLLIYIFSIIYYFFYVAYGPYGLLCLECPLDRQLFFVLSIHIEFLVILFFTAAFYIIFKQGIQKTMEKKYKQLILETKGPKGEVLWITLDNQKTMNAMSDIMQQELLQLLNQIAFDNSIRCVVLTGSGAKSFSSGGDIELFRSFDRVSGYDYAYNRGNTIQHLMNYMEKPIIAAVNGYCFAGGMELALCCDFIYASHNAKFGLPEINLGLLPGWGGTVRLPRKIPVNKAKEMIYRGEILTADQAYHWGLVNKVLPSIDELYEAVDQIVSEIIAKAPLALRAAKNIINNSITCENIEAALAIERGACSWLLDSEDSREGVNAFLDKRKPQFKGI
jgi:enoyl-CoA hydratase